MDIIIVIGIIVILFSCCYFLAWLSIEYVNKAEGIEGGNPLDLKRLFSKKNNKI